MTALGNPFLTQAGFLAGAISVRLGWQAHFPDQIHDPKAAIRWLPSSFQRLPDRPDRIGIMGDSAGGHLAAMALFVTVEYVASPVRSGVTTTIPQYRPILLFRYGRRGFLRRD